MNLYEKRQKLCKSCKNYKHKDNNIKKQFQCVLKEYQCDICGSRYEKVDNIDERNKELNDYDLYVQKQNRYEMIGINIGIGMIVLNIIAVAWLAIYSTVYWFQNDGLTYMQVFKYTVSKNPIPSIYILVFSIICFISSLKKSL